MVKKGVYLRVCANHPTRTEGLWYTYNGIPDHKSGQLLCKECVNESSESDQGEMPDVREDDAEQETSSDV
jgi:hypothetical protein